MELVKDELKIKIFDTRERMGRAAADDVAFFNCGTPSLRCLHR